MKDKIWGPNSNFIKVSNIAFFEMRSNAPTHRWTQSWRSDPTQTELAMRGQRTLFPVWWTSHTERELWRAPPRFWSVERQCGPKSCAWCHATILRTPPVDFSRAVNLSPGRSHRRVSPRFLWPAPVPPRASLKAREEEGHRQTLQNVRLRSVYANWSDWCRTAFDPSSWTCISGESTFLMLVMRCGIGGPPPTVRRHITDGSRTETSAGDSDV